MKATVFIKQQGDRDEYEVGFTIGVQTFHLNMGSDGIRPKEEALWHKRMLEHALDNLVSGAEEPEE